MKAETYTEIHGKELEAWDRNVTFYKREIASPIFKILHEIKKRVFDLDADRGWILDLGCGTGYFSHSIIDVNKKIVAVDFSQEMIKEGKKTFGEDGILWVVGNADNLPLKDKSINIVIANGAFHHFKAQGIYRDSIKEVTRVICKKGKLCLFDRNGSYISSIVHELVIMAKKILVRLKGEFPSSSTCCEPPYTDGDLGELLKENFSIVKRTYLNTIPTFLIIVLTNSIEYFISQRLANKLRKITSPLVALFEKMFPVKAITVEQCVNLIKE